MLYQPVNWHLYSKGWSKGAYILNRIRLEFHGRLVERCDDYPVKHVYFFDRYTPRAAARLNRRAGGSPSDCLFLYSLQMSHAVLLFGMREVVCSPEPNQGIEPRQ